MTEINTKVCVCGSKVTSLCGSGLWPDRAASVVRSLCEPCCLLAIVSSASRSPFPSLCLWGGCVSQLWKEDVQLHSRTDNLGKSYRVTGQSSAITSFCGVAPAPSLVLPLLFFPVIRFVFPCHLLWGFYS